MDESDVTLPDVFYSLLDQRTKAAEITNALLERYCEIIQNSPTFLPEIIELIGQDSLIKIIQSYGGITLEIPTANDILSTVRKNRNES